jgi:hypothetical protein
MTKLNDKTIIAFFKFVENVLDKHPKLSSLLIMVCGVNIFIYILKYSN